MPTFQNLIDTIKDPQQHQTLRIDTIKKIESITQRPLIVYAANTRRGGPQVPNAIDDSDITGFSDLIEGIISKEIDILLHSPGGSAEATERIVNLLRQNFSHVRFVVPHTAYSAATMLALSGDEILMDERSTLGPIDPQIGITTKEGTSFVPADDILLGFQRIRDYLKDHPEAIGAYIPMLQKYDIHVFEFCENAKKLAKVLVQEWLKSYMFKDKPDKDERAASVANWLSQHGEHLSHGRPVNIEKCKNYGLNVGDLRATPELRDAIWKYYCLTELFFDRTPSVKMFENSKGTSWSRQFQMIQAVIPMIPPQVPPGPPPQIASN
jgi:Serine dehydrogenase proteinase